MVSLARPGRKFKVAVVKRPYLQDDTSESHVAEKLYFMYRHRPDCGLQPIRPNKSGQIVEISATMHSWLVQPARHVPPSGRRFA
jgi:hypothetical protein